LIITGYERHELLDKETVQLDDEWKSPTDLREEQSLHQQHAIRRLQDLPDNDDPVQHPRRHNDIIQEIPVQAQIDVPEGAPVAPVPEEMPVPEGEEEQREIIHDAYDEINDDASTVH
jgi:hypothetical protein